MLNSGKMYTRLKGNCGMEGKQKDGYQRKVDKSLIPTCNIMGVNIAAINMEWLLEYLKKNLSDIKGDYICVSNVHTTVTSYDSVSYCAIQNGGLMAIPDGGPLSSVGRKRGHKEMERTTGPSLMGEIFQISAEKGYRHYFYGSTEETLKLLEKKLKENYPGIQIAGMYSPPFRVLTEEEDRQIVENINSAKADFVWIGLGAPKQERWMAVHQGKIDGLMIGVGAGFDYYAGNIKRAPLWMQKCNLEWLYRLMQDPKRLFKRYFYTNTKFIWNAVVRGR
jgi:N-acetylglucosaminyldiphosphoundecaprenol N-acetyl-beta-D-mannosaminyltransferase